MKLLHISAMGLCAVTLAAAYGCSSSETERNPIFVDAAGGSKASGGGSSLGTGGSKASGGGASLGMGGSKASGGGASIGSGGKGSGGANNNASGGTNNNASGGTNNNASGGTNNASGGANSASGGANNSACAPTAAGVAAMLATHKCGECHASEFTTEAGLTMQIDMADEAGKREMCGSHVIVAPGDPSMSTLYLKLAGMDVPNCGEQMPKGETALSAAELTCVSAWITDAMAP